MFSRKASVFSHQKGAIFIKRNKINLLQNRHSRCTKQERLYKEKEKTR